MPELKPMRRLTKLQTKDRQKMKFITHLLTHLLTRFKQAPKLRGMSMQFISQDCVQRCLQALHERIVNGRYIVAEPEARLLLRVLCEMQENLRESPKLPVQVDKLRLRCAGVWDKHREKHVPILPGRRQILDRVLLRVTRMIIESKV